MTGEQLISYLTWVVFLVLFALVARAALRHPLWANLNLVLLFAAPSAIIAISIAAELGLVQPGPLPNAVNTTLLLAIAYLMLRLADDFASAPRWLLRAGAALFALLSLCAFIFPPPRPAWVTVGQVLYFFGLELYAAVAFVRAARGATGVTRRRMRAVALGSLLLGLAVLASALRGLAPWLAPGVQLFALGAGVSYFLGFITPPGLRRTWQEPELRAFLARAGAFARPSGQAAALRELELAAALTFGTEDARISRWDEGRQLLETTYNGEDLAFAPDESSATGRAFLSQRPQFATYRAGVADRPTPPAFRQLAALPRAVLAAPISSGQRRFGVLTILTRRAPIVVAEDIALAELLAGQIAATLETRALAEELARTRALAEAARLKEDFLSAAAHDLKTPLTTVLGQAQRLERRMGGDPGAAAYLPGVELIVRESQRLRRIVNELLDAVRAERGQLVSEREPMDLAAMVHEVAARYDSPRHRCLVSGDEALVGSFDRQRVRQLLEHLLDNAVLYSPQGGTVQIGLRRERGDAVVTVGDQGIGIPPDDLPRLFGRFFRGSNVDDRNYAGMGLSLYICRAIAEQHGGRIEVSSHLGSGSTFTVTLPLSSEQVSYVAA